MSIARNDWLWDRNISVQEARRILKRPEDERFILIASLLFSRKNEPEEVFKNYIDPLLFTKYWIRIKKRMRQDKWAGDRIIFWQAIYEKLIERYRKKGIKFRHLNSVVRDELYDSVGKTVRNIRAEAGWSQKELAQKAGISQQLISRIEKGRENISLATLRKISGALGRELEINFEKLP